MNIIYITGAPRCGKTTLCKNLISNQSNISILSLDSFSKSIRWTFNDFNLYSKRGLIQPDINREKFLKLVSDYINLFNADYAQQTLIVEGCHFHPDEFSSVFPKAKIICLGITSSLEDCLKAVESSDWMSVLDKKTKMAYAEKNI